MRRSWATVITNQAIMPDTHLLSLESPAIARAGSAGQFVHIRCGSEWDPLLRRPMSLMRAQGDEIQIMVKAVGRGSKYLATRKPGDMLDCLGPQGRSFKLEPTARHILLVGGGYGVSPMVFLAEEALHRDMSVTLLVGAAEAGRVFPSHLLPAPVEYRVSTVDGSMGHKGLVTDLAAELLEWADSLYACGPMPMLAALGRLCRNSMRGKRVEFSVENYMGCAMGVCLGCVVPTRSGPKRVCRDGPVFPMRELAWEW